MSKIKTAGDLRGFLADVMLDIRAGAVEAGDALAIAKVAAQINQSLAAEINAALQMERMGKGGMVAGAMLIGAETNVAPEAAHGFSSEGKAWCDQCEALIPFADAASCRSRFCKLAGSAQAIEARRAATGTGAVHESAVGSADASTPRQDNPHPTPTDGEEA